MDKLILFLTGDFDKGKSLITKIAREHGIWTWNVNPYDVIKTFANNAGMTPREIECVIPKYRLNYVIETITRLIPDKNARLLVVHGCGKKIFEEAEMCFSGKDIEMKYLSLSSKDFDEEKAFVKMILDIFKKSGILIGEKK